MALASCVTVKSGPASRRGAGIVPLYPVALWPTRQAGTPAVLSVDLAAPIGVYRPDAMDATLLGSTIPRLGIAARITLAT
jgi:hypothetical protein